MELLRREGVVASTVRAGENVRLQKGRLMRMSERVKFKQGQPRGKYVLIKMTVCFDDALLSFCMTGSGTEKYRGEGAGRGFMPLY